MDGTEGRQVGGDRGQHVRRAAAPPDHLRALWTNQLTAEVTVGGLPPEHLREGPEPDSYFICIYKTQTGTL